MAQQQAEVAMLEVMEFLKDDFLKRSDEAISNGDIDRSVGWERAARVLTQRLEA